MLLFSTLLAFLATIQVARAVLSPEDEMYFRKEADRYDWTKHPCRRQCNDGEAPKECYYVFVVEQYSTMSKACFNCPVNFADCFRPHCIPADGRQKTVYVVNRQMPGPLIQACENDQIIVEVRNTMLSESTAIHWHGFHMKGTPYMDGVPYVTQCPILPGESFQYIFTANMAGTFFWHSHIGSQRSDGLFGALLIHQSPRNNIHAKLYDYDQHPMQIIDWMAQEGSDGLTEMYHFRPRVRPETILINGLGRFRPYRNAKGNRVFTPSAVFSVTRGQRYRFRLIDAGAEDCPIEMSIDNHRVSVISVDGSDVKAVMVDAITVWPGERVDFVLNANQRADNYWIRYRGHGQCDPSNTTTGIFQVAILRYDGARAVDPSGATGYNIPAVNNRTRIFNPYNRGTESPNFEFVSVPDLVSAEPDDRSLNRRADVQHFINFDFYPKDNYDFHRPNLYGFNQVANDSQIGTFQLNHLTLRMQPFPLLSQWDQLRPGSLCNIQNPPGGADCTRRQCACTHVIPLGLNQVVEIVLVDEGVYGLVNHPLHLHGHSFRVVATENLSSNVTVDMIRQMDREGRITRNLQRAPKKDTMKAPGGGYTVIRFVADNPGYWFFHCHFEQHTNVGMALVFKVGEHRDFPPKPRGFPKCGGYTPIDTSS